MIDIDRKLLDLIKTLADATTKSDDKILSLIETLKDALIKLNERLLDLDERVHRLENKK